MTTTDDRTQPTVANDAWIAPGAILIGDLTIGSSASIWFGSWFGRTRKGSSSASETEHPGRHHDALGSGTAARGG